MQAPHPDALLLQDRPSKTLNILSFLCPPIGLVIYLALVGKLPRQALSAGLSAAKGAATLLGLLLLLGLFFLGVWFTHDVLHIFSEPPNTESTVSTNAPPGAPPVAPR